jgi:hypothetical protein
MHALGALAVAGASLAWSIDNNLSIVLHLLALRHIGTSRQAAYLATAPFVGAVASVPVLGERLGWTDVAAGLVMAAGCPSWSGPDMGTGTCTKRPCTTTPTFMTSTTITSTGRASLQRPTPTCTGTSRWPTTTRTSRTRITGTGTDLGRRRVDGGGLPPHQGPPTGAAGR